MVATEEDVVGATSGDGVGVALEGRMGAGAGEDLVARAGDVGGMEGSEGGATRGVTVAATGGEATEGRDEEATTVLGAGAEVGAGVVWIKVNWKRVTACISPLGEGGGPDRRRGGYGGGRGGGYGGNRGAPTYDSEGFQTRGAPTYDAEGFQSRGGGPAAY